MGACSRTLGACCGMLRACSMTLGACCGTLGACCGMLGACSLLWDAGCLLQDAGCPLQHAGPVFMAQPELHPQCDANTSTLGTQGWQRPPQGSGILKLKWNAGIRRVKLHQVGQLKGDDTQFENGLSGLRRTSADFWWCCPRQTQAAAPAPCLLLPAVVHCDWAHSQEPSGNSRAIGSITPV